LVRGEKKLIDVTHVLFDPFLNFAHNLRSLPSLRNDTQDVVNIVEKPLNLSDVHLVKLLDELGLLPLGSLDQLLKKVWPLEAVTYRGPRIKTRLLLDILLRSL
jgi:hypothetical protein